MTKIGNVNVLTDFIYCYKKEYKRKNKEEKIFLCTYYLLIVNGIFLDAYY